MFRGEDRSAGVKREGGVQMNFLRKTIYRRAREKQKIYFEGCERAYISEASPVHQHQRVKLSKSESRGGE